MEDAICNAMAEGMIREKSKKPNPTSTLKSQNWAFLDSGLTENLYSSGFFFWFFEKRQNSGEYM